MTLQTPKVFNTFRTFIRHNSGVAASISRTSPTSTTNTATKSSVTFKYQDIFETSKPSSTPYYKLDQASKYVSTKDRFLILQPEALSILTETAMRDIAHLLRPGHLQSLSNIYHDPEASSNDKFVALQLLKNANIASGFVLPGCQDTGTAIVMGKKGQFVITDSPDGSYVCDEESISKGVFEAYVNSNLRYSQVSPIDMFKEVNTNCNLPAQVEIFSTPGNEYHFHFMAKGGGSANKTYLFQETKALLNPKVLIPFLKEKIAYIGTSACPPYHLAVVIGGLSAEQNLKTVKLASARYYDNLYESGNEFGRGFRDIETEKQLEQVGKTLGIGAQFGGKYFFHDVRVIRLPRHGASCPVGIAVSCSADRQAKAKITKDGVFLERLEVDPAKYLPEVKAEDLKSSVVDVNLDRPMNEILAELDKYPVKTRLNVSGTLIVARDIAHAKLKERLEQTGTLPEYFKNHIVYYAGPAKTPKSGGFASGSFGPTTAGRMDSYVDMFQKAGGSKVMLAKGNRSRVVTEACRKNNGFYLGSIGGPAAVLAKESIKSIEVLEFPELGMEAVWKVRVENFPAFVVVDNKGNDFFQQYGN